MFMVIVKIPEVARLKIMEIQFISESSGESKGKEQLFTIYKVQIGKD